MEQPLAADDRNRVLAHLPNLAGPGNLPDPKLPVEGQPDDLLLAMLIWGEARSESVMGKIAVAQVVANRVAAGGWFGRGWHAVMLKTNQFSCFNIQDPNYKKLLQPVSWDAEAVWQTCLYIARAALRGALPSVVDGCCHYHAAAISVPAWANKLVLYKVVGRHKFYRSRPGQP